MNSMLCKLEFYETLRALRFMCEKIGRTDVKWVVSGPTSLALRGVGVPAVNSIDIVTTFGGVREIDEVLSEYRIQAPAFYANEKFKSFRGAYCLGDVKIDVAGGFQYRRASGEWSDVRSSVANETVDLGGAIVGVYSLERELCDCEGMGRAADADAIRSKLAEIRAEKGLSGKIIHAGFAANSNSVLRKAYRFTQVCAAAACFAFFILMLPMLGADNAELELAKAARPVKRPNVTHYVEAKSAKPGIGEMAEGEDLQFCGLEAE